jgi:monoamine oxidase
VLQKAGQESWCSGAPVSGGRVRTIHTSFSDGLYGEAGAVRISSAHQTVLQLVRELGLPLVPFASSTDRPSSARTA